MTALNPNPAMHITQVVTAKEWKHQKRSLHFVFAVMIKFYVCKYYLAANIHYQGKENLAHKRST